jgi:hypothetical protein
VILAHHRMWRDAEATKAAPAPIVADIAETGAPTAPPPREAPKTAQQPQPPRAQR